MIRILPWLAAVALVACSGRSRAPELQGELGDVLIQASFAGEPALPLVRGPLLLDSVSFGRLATLVGESVTPTARDVAMVDAGTILECPSRAPCHLIGDRVYMSVWDASAGGDSLTLVVSRTYNVQGLYRMTESVVHRLALERTGAVWRLVRRERLPS